MATPNHSSPHRSIKAADVAFIALMLGMLMAQLDTNVVVAAIPVITSDLNLGSAIAGITASTLLTVTVSTPIWGKLGDVLGRRTVFVASVSIFAIASVLCATAVSSAMLIAGRALQGVGAGGMIVTAVSTVAIIYSKDELIRRQIWLTAVFAVSSLAGPPVGGLLANMWGWRSIFYINIPLCIAAVVIGALTIPTRQKSGSMEKFDFPAAIAIVIGGTSLVALGSSETVATSFAYATAACLVTVAAVIFLAWHEQRALSPLIPPGLFKIPILKGSIVTTLLVGVSLFGTFTYIPLALTTGAGIGSEYVGPLLLALTGGQLVIITSFSLLVRKYKNLMVWNRFAISIGTVGLSVLAAISLVPEQISIVVASLGLFLSGAALGLSLQVLTLMGQSSAPPDQIGSAMGTITFTRQLGGVIGAAGFGWVAILAPVGSAAPAAVLGTAAILLLAAMFFLPGKSYYAADNPENGIKDSQSE